MSGNQVTFAGPDGDSQAISTDGKALPKDAQVITSILKDMGHTEYDPKVLNQLMEFLYRYVTSVVEDAKLVSSHSKKKVVDVEDIRLAVQMYNQQTAAPPPARDVLIETARVRNAQPLPVPKTSSGLRLPPDRYCLTACNYKLANNVRKTASHINRTTPTFTVRGSGVAQQSRPVIMNQTSVPRIQIQPASTGGVTPGATFTMTMNPQLTTLKRKAE